MLHKKFNQDLSTYFFKRKVDSCEVKKFVYVLNYLKIFKAVAKSNPRRHSSQQNKKAVMTTAQSLYFLKVAETIIMLCLPSIPKKGVSGIKQKK